MISLLIAIGGSFVLLLMFFFCIPFYKPLKIVIILIQIIFVLAYFDGFSKNKGFIPSYSNIILASYDIIDYSKLPIKDFDIVKSDDGKTLKFKFQRSLEEYKTSKDNEYKKECLKNYFIKKDGECPITDIIVQKEKNNTLLNNLGYKEKNPFNNVFFYYTNTKSDGKLYTNINASKVNDENNEAEADITIDGYNYEIYFNTTNTTNNAKKEVYSLKDENLLKYLDFSIYIYIICFILLSTTFMYSFCEPWNSRIYNYYILIDWIIYLINMVLFIVRYIKIIEIKKLCASNGCDETFEKYLKVDMMPLALSVAVILIYIIYLITPRNCHFNHQKYGNEFYNNRYIEPHPQNPHEYSDLNKKTMNILYFLFPLDIMFIVIFILVVINDNKIKSSYKYENFIEDLIPSINYTYLTTDVINCSLSSTKKYNYNDMSNKNGKICGKDNYGFDLYFPKNEECPINDVYLGLEGDEKEGYSKVYCPDHLSYLYYTNTNIEGKIIETLRGESISYNYGDDDDDDYDYDDDDYNYLYDYRDYSYYFTVDKIINKNNKMKDLTKINIGKYILFGIFIIIIIYFSILFSLKEPKIVLLGCGIFLLLFSLSFLIISIICLHYKTKYIQKIISLSKYNKNTKCNFISDILLVIFLLYFFIYFIIILIYKFLLKDECTCDCACDCTCDCACDCSCDCTCLKTCLNKLKNICKREERAVSENSVNIIQVQRKKEKENKNEDNKSNGSSNEIKIANNDINNLKISENKAETVDKLVLKKSTFKNPCTICISKESSVIISPCGHRCLCQECYNDMKAQLTICPICRQKVISVVERVYDA